MSVADEDSLDWSETAAPTEHEEGASVASQRWRCPYCYRSYTEAIFLRRHLAKHLERKDHATGLKKYASTGPCNYIDRDATPCGELGTYVALRRKKVEYFCEDHRCKEEHADTQGPRDRKSVV